MANKTVYPYGQNGQIPSGYPIADDLETNSAQQALSAKQGKVIGDYLFGTYTDIDISGVTISDFSLGANTTQNNRWTKSTAKHFVLPVEPGTTLRFIVGGSGGFYGFLASYTVPTAATSPVNYALGYSRVWRTPGTYTVIVPEGASYLCVCTVDGDGNTSSWKLALFQEPTNNYIEEGTPELMAEVIEPVDITSIAEADCYIGANSWGNATGKHIVIPVSSGQKIMIRPTGSTSSGNFSAFFTSAYTTPSPNAVIPYVSGTTRVWRSDRDGWVTLTCPHNTAYLALVTRNGDGDTTIWEVQKAREIPIRERVEDYSLSTLDIVNNLVDGGTDAPLSAEQGKVLFEKYSDGFPLGITRHAYSGAMVKIRETHYVGTKKVATVTSQNFQGGACFGDYLFMFTENNTTCWIYNLATNTLVQTITIPSEERGFVSDCHCNTVNFGVEYYDANDPFPLIYVSTGFALGGYSSENLAGALVYRVVATTENDITTYSLSLVQTLKMPGTTWTEFLVGEDGCCYLCYTGQRKIYKMKMPLLSDGDITFDLTQALSVYQFSQQPSWYNGSRNQNRIYHNGKIYMVSGVPASSETSLFIVLDLATETREVEIDLINTLGLTSEPETCFFWRGHICVAFRKNTAIYALYFE